MNRKRKIILSVFIVALIFVIVWVSLRVFVSEYPLLVVVSGSMKPTLEVGDLIVVQRVVNFSEIEADSNLQGTVIVFHSPPKPNDLIVHRVVDKFLKEDGLWYFTTRGDNNPASIPWEVNFSQTYVVGKVVWKIPLIGRVVLFIRTPLGLSICLILMIVLTAIEIASRKRKIMRKMNIEAGTYQERAKI